MEASLEELLAYPNPQLPCLAQLLLAPPKAETDAKYTTDAHQHVRVCSSHRMAYRSQRMMKHSQMSLRMLAPLDQLWKSPPSTGISKSFSGTHRSKISVIQG